MKQLNLFEDYNDKDVRELQEDPFVGMPLPSTKELAIAFDQAYEAALAKEQLNEFLEGLNGSK
jgi:hypothetical protein